MKTKGQSMVEYSLILALAAVVCISSLKLLGSSIHDQITGLSDSITRASTVTVAAANNPGLPASGGGSQPATGATDTSGSGQTSSDLSAVDSGNSGSTSTSRSGDTFSLGDTVTPSVGAVPDPDLIPSATAPAVPTSSQASDNDCHSSLGILCGSWVDAGTSWGF